MSNKYTPCGGFIISTDGKQYPVETAHPLPLPEGIDGQRGSSAFINIAYGRPGVGWEGLKGTHSTHWLARRPLPEVPKVKTQEELDEEFIQSELMYLSAMLVNRIPEVEKSLQRTIKHARQCPSTPAQQQPAA